MIYLKIKASNPQSAARIAASWNIRFTDNARDVDGEIHAECRDSFEAQVRLWAKAGKGSLIWWSY